MDHIFPASLSSRQADEILEGALLLLEQTGLAIPQSSCDLEARLVKSGFPCRSGRVRLPRSLALEYLDYLRKLPRKDPPCESGLQGVISIYSSHVAGLTGKTVLFDAASLENWADFCRRCGERYGFTANVPGYAADVPAQLESLHKYAVSAKYCQQAILEPSSCLSASYMLEMADVLDVKERRFPAFPASPLSLAGSSVEMVLENASHLDSAYVYAMSMMGVTTPMSVTGGFAVNLAEVLGCAVVLHHLTGLPVEIRPNLIPFDMRACAVSFGSPEKFTLELLSAQLYGHLMNAPIHYRSANIHTYAGTCGAQSTFEKGWMMAAATVLGARSFYCIGTLSMDELFSPVQLIWDLEMMRQLERLPVGFAPEHLPADFVNLVEADMHEGFMASDSTLEHYGIVGPPGIFSRSGLGAREAGDCRDALEKAREIAGEIAAQEPALLLAQDKATELDKIYQKAKESIV